MFRAYDRAAIKFRGVDADINFNSSDYEEDMKQVRILLNNKLLSFVSYYFLFPFSGLGRGVVVDINCNIDGL